MRTMTLQSAEHSLSEVIGYSLKTHDEICIASDDGAVVVIPQSDYDSMQETLRVLSDKKSLLALLEGHFARDHEKGLKSYSVEEAFGDL